MTRRPPITNQVKAYRERHGGLIQAQLGEAVGVTRHTIIAIEQGHYSPSLETAFRIARLFGAPIESIFDPGERPE